MIAGLLALLEDVFGGLLNASWQASVLALLVAVLQWALGARLNPRWRYALWLLVLGRLLLPVQPESALSLFRFTPEPPAAFVAPITEPLFAPAPPSAPVPAITMVTTGDGVAFSFYSALALVWLAGAMILFVFTWRVNRLFARQMARSPEVGDPVLLALFAASKIELNIRRSIRLVESGQVQGPAITGLFHPTLLLPMRVREKFDETELRLIFLHELAHLKRGDVMVQALIALLQILHWFNPVLWLAFRRMRLDREPATDALVLSRAGEAEKERYGLMLIKLLEHFNQRHSLPTLVGILEDKDQFKRRFSLIARFTREAYGWSVLGVALVGILSVACLTRSHADGKATAISLTAGSSETGSNKMVRVSSKVIQISEEDYQAHLEEIDAAVKKGDYEPLSRLKSFDLLSEPAVLMRSGERGVMEAVRVLPYAIAYQKEKDGKMTPTEFKRKNIGVTFPLSTVITEGKISLTGELEVTTLRGWIPAGNASFQPIFQTRRIPLASVLVDSGQTVGLMAANLQADSSDPEAYFGPGNAAPQPKRSTSLCRLFLFLNAQVNSAAKPAGEAVAGMSATNAIRNANDLMNDNSLLMTPVSGPGVGIVGSLREPVQAGESLTVRAFLAPPHFFHVPGADVPPTTPADPSTATERASAMALEELSARSVQFPSGSTVTLLPESGKLVVRDTPEQLDLIAHLIEEQAKVNPPTDAPNAIQKANSLLDHDYLLPPPVKGPGVEIVGKLKEPGQVDFSRSSGLLLSVDGVGYKFGFAADGSFTVPHVQPGVYNRYLRLIGKSDSASGPISSSPNMEPVTVEAGAVHLTMNMAMDRPFDLPLAAGEVEINLKVATVDEDDYDAHRELFDEAMKKGGPDLIRLLVNRKGVDLIATPSVTTNDGKKAHIDIVREFPYPTSFTTDKNGKVTPDTFTTADVGIKADAIAKREYGKIQLNCALTITDFDGFTDSNMGVKLPTFHTVESHVVEEMASGELKGVWIPGNLFNKQTIHTNGTPASSDVHRITSQRILLFLSARDT